MHDPTGLRAALSDTAAEVIVLSRHGSPYRLDEQLVLSRSVSLLGEMAGGDAQVIIEAQAARSSFFRVLFVGENITVSLTNLQITGGFHNSSGAVSAGLASNADPY